MSSSESLNDCSSDMSSEVKDSATRQSEQFSSGNCSERSSNSKQGSEAGNEPVEGDDIGFRNFLEEYTIVISEVAARFWEKMPNSQRAMFYDRSEVGKKSSVASSANDKEETASSASRGCEPKKPQKKSCARPIRKACPKSIKSIKRRYSKPKCPKPRAPKRCPKPRAAKTCPKPRAAKRCPKPMSAKKFPKPNPACPMPRVFIQSEDPKPAFPSPMALVQREDPKLAFPKPKLLFHFDDPTPISMKIFDSEGPNSSN